MSTYHAAICEDEEKILAYLLRKLGQAFEHFGLDFSFDGYASGMELLKELSTGKTFDLLFLDIEMPRLNGIELCRRIRAINPDVLVIFISNKEELVFQTFEVRPFRFVRKSHFKEELPQLILDIKHELEKQIGHTITIREQNSTNVYSLNVNQILYAEVIGKYCNIVTTTKALTVKYTITDLEDLLADYGFLRPHRSYLVNYRYIYQINSHEVVLDDQSSIPLSKQRVEKIKTQFLLLSQRDFT